MKTDSDEHRAEALILAPHGRDAGVASALLAEAGIPSRVCADFGAFERALGERASLAVLTEETLRTSDLRFIAGWVAAQPSWSDIPFVVLTQHGGGPERNPFAARLSEALGNVSFIERPFHPTTFISVVRTALKGRQRQFEARSRLEELQESRARLQIALLAGRLGSWELDPGNAALTASNVCKELFGRSASDPFTYGDLIASIHPEDRARAQDVVRASIKTNADYAAEYRVIRPDGTLRWAEVRARVVSDGGGKKVLIGVSSDVTERKTAEENLRRLNETLEERVAERTFELERAHALVLEEIAQRERAEELLRQSQKMEMIGQLTGGVAHDFNNLLTAVLGNLDLLRKHATGNGRTERLLEGAIQGAQRGAALTQRLLAFARRQDLEIEPRNLADLIRGMTDLLERSVGPEIELRIELPSKLPLALVDANQIELALLNMVVNARDAMPDGGSLTITVDVAGAAGDDELPAGDFVRLLVEDTGSGMDELTLKRATEPFFSTKELGKGTGLGLSMIHGLAMQLHGALRLKSEVGKGTRAELWLPLTDQIAEPAKRPTIADVDALAIPKATILVVDDDALIARSTIAMLEDLGHDAIEANSGARALEILRDAPEIGLLITDFSMPKMTGVQLARSARALRPDLPVLLATGYADLPPGSDVDLPRLGKPYRQDQLATEIGKILR